MVVFILMPGVGSQVAANQIAVIVYGMLSRKHPKRMITLGTTIRKKYWAIGVAKEWASEVLKILKALGIEAMLEK